MSGFHLPDLDAYFARIGYQGPRTPTLATLHAITAHHAASIPSLRLPGCLAQKRQLRSYPELREVLLGEFGLSLPEGTRFEILDLE